jgi:hypothetical protein
MHEEEFGLKVQPQIISAVALGGESVALPAGAKTRYPVIRRPIGPCELFKMLIRTVQFNVNIVFFWKVMSNRHISTRLHGVTPQNTAAITPYAHLTQCVIGLYCPDFCTQVYPVISERMVQLRCSEKSVNNKIDT